MFIAVKGNIFDGHKFINTAIRKGASIIIVSKNIKCKKSVNLIKVNNCTQALGQIALWHRKKFDIPGSPDF